MTLTQASARFRIGVKIFAACFVFYYILTLAIIPVASRIIASVLPEKDPPNPIFGQLDPLEFTAKSLLNQNPVYSLNTKNGRLPADLPVKVPVYKFKQPRFSYEAGKNARKEAAELGFTDDDLVSDLKGTLYKWRDIKTGGTLDINTDNRDLNMTTPIEGRSFLFSATFLNKETAISLAKNLFQRLGRFNDQLYPMGKQTAVLGKFTNDSLVETTQVADAQLARVDFFRSVGAYKIMGPDAKKGLLSAYVKVPDSALKTLNFPIVEGHFWEIDTQSNATYPLISVQDAWNAVSKNSGIISNITPKVSNIFKQYTPIQVDKILINNIYIAYYETPKLLKVLQPIYVFEGNYTTAGTQGGDITIYFPAIRGDYIKQPVQQPKATQ